MRSATNEARERWIAAATGLGPTRSTLDRMVTEVREDADAEAAASAALRSRPPKETSRHRRPGSRAPEKSSSAAAPIDLILRRLDSIRRALDDKGKAWWASEGAQLERAIHAVRWDLDVVRRGRAAAGDPPWGADAEDALHAEAPEPPPALPEGEAERVRAGGAELRALRDASGLTQAQVAERIARDGLAPASARVALARFEAGRGGLSRSVLDAATAACRARHVRHRL